MGLDAYKPLTEIGRGGMGLVLRGRSPEGRDVAIKILLKSSSRKMLARFDREKRLLMELSEEAGFVPLLDSGEAPQGPYLVMPFVGGGTLRDKVYRGALTVEVAVGLVTKLAAAIARAHAAGIVHRDLKPENVIFTTDGRPLIADLGLAKHFRQDEGDAKSVSLSNPGTAIGTFGYMSAEQMKNAKVAGPEVDVYALGVILYECIAGEPPFRSDNILGLMEKVERGVYKPLPSEVPAWVRAVVGKALSVDTEARYPDGAALTEALEGGEGGPGGGRRLAIAVGGVAVIAVLGVMALMHFHKKPVPVSVVVPVVPIAPVATATVAPVASTAAAQEKPGKKERALLEEAEAAAAAGKRPEAFKAYLSLGIRALEKDHPKLAVKAFQGAVQFSDTLEDEGEALTQLGFAEMHTGEYASSCEHTRRAVKISPEDALPRNNLAYSLHMLGKDSEALDEYRHCLELDPDQNLARMTMGIVARLAGNGRKALSAHKALREKTEKGILLDPFGTWFFAFESKRSLATAAGVTFASEQERVALVSLEIALDQAFLDDLGAAEETVAAVREVLKPDELEAPIDKVLDDIQRALELKPELFRLRYVAGLLLVVRGETLRAREELEAFRVREAERVGPYAGKAQKLIDALK